MTLEALSASGPPLTARPAVEESTPHDAMRMSIRTTMLAIVLPLAAVTLAMSAARIADFVAIRQDIAGLRDSAFRSIYVERYAHNLHSLLKASFDHLGGRDEGFEAVASARATPRRSEVPGSVFGHRAMGASAPRSGPTRTTSP